MSAPKLCKDCRWSFASVGPRSDDDRFRKCSRPHLPPEFPQGWTYVVLERGVRTWADSCGPTGRYFASRNPSRLRRILAALGLATLAGCAADADAILVAAAVLAPLWVLVVARRLRRRWA